MPYTLDPSRKGSFITLSGGNLVATSTGATWGHVKGTLTLDTRPIYLEVLIGSIANYLMVGWGTDAASVENYCGVDANGYSWGHSTGQLWHSGPLGVFGTPSAPGDLLMMAYHPVTGKGWFGKGGTWFGSGNPASGVNPAFTWTATGIKPAITLFGNGIYVTVNFGSTNPVYAIPAGFFMPDRFTTYAISGTAKFSDGAVATVLRVMDFTTGALISEIVPDPATGSFTLSSLSSAVTVFVMIYRSGYRPLAAGPITPFQVN